MLGLVAPDHHSEEARLTVPPAAHGHWEHGPAMPLSVCRSSGSSVRLSAKLTLASVMVLLGRPGRAGCAPLEPGNGGRLGMPKAAGQAAEPTKSAGLDQAAEYVRLEMMVKEGSSHCDAACGAWVWCWQAGAGRGSDPSSHWPSPPDLAGNSTDPKVIAE